ncbi:MAG: VRR-NUC domain-containing protein, partial [Actinomycetota bacterium]
MAAGRLALSEAAFQDQVVDLARLRGWLVYHTFDSRHSAAGFPDLILARGDRLVAAELKTQRG